MNKALEELKFQVGNITYFHHDSEGALYTATYELKDSGLFEIIEKDLELLEILKPYIKIHKDVLSNGITYYFLNGLETDKETYDRVKEWLENDT